jgi:Family of unknown function (DUF6011)
MTSTPTSREQETSMPTATSTFRGRILSPETAVRFILAGDARVTFLNEATGTRFTYRVTAPKVDTARGGRVTDLTSPMRFVALADNESTFAYLGFIRAGTDFQWGRKSRVREDAPSVQAFYSVWETLRGEGGAIPAGVSIWHEGHCGRCGRTLTVPASIASGFGPDCAALLGIDQEAERVSVSAVVDPASLAGPASAGCCMAAVAGDDCTCALDAPAVAIAGASDVEVRAPLANWPVTAAPVAPPVRPCWKCGGTGRFITRYGRDFGPCFACQGGGR